MLYQWFSARGFKLWLFAVAAMLCATCMKSKVQVDVASGKAATNANAPSPISSFSSSSIKTTQKDAAGSAVVLSWSAPSSAVTGVTYSIYKSTDGSLSTLSDLKSKATSVATGLSTTSYTVDRLAPAVTTYFYVVADDGSGHQAVSRPSAFTGAPIPPTAGGSGALTSPNAGVNGTSINLQWQTATGVDGTSNGITYSVYQSSSNNLDTLAHILANGTLLTGTGLAAGTTQYTVNGLTPATTYYFVVVAKDTSGNQTVYSSVSAATSSDVTPPTAGNAGTITKTGVTAGGFTTNWTAGTDGVTSAASLQYRVYYSAANNIATASAAQSNGTAVNNWTSNITSLPITGLVPSTTYYVNVLVKDDAGNISSYTSSSQATAADSTVPTAGNSGTITFNSVTTGGFTVNWTYGSDDVTATSSLQYRVYYSTSNNITTAANAQSNGTAANAWTTNINTLGISGLTPGITYYVNVLVKDAAGNIGSSTSNAQATTADTTPPTVGNSGTITTASVASTSLTLNWTASSDDTTAAASLQYIVYKSTSNNINSVANANTNGTVLQTWTSNIATYNVTGLTASTTYYFNVVVRDLSANKTAYTTVSATTTSGGGGGGNGNTATRYIFATNATFTGGQVGAQGSAQTPTYGADDTCRSEAAAGSVTAPLTATNWSWNALIGVYGNTMRSRANLPTNITVMNTAGAQLSSTEAYLFTTGTMASVHYNANGVTNFNNTWTAGDPSVTSCNYWTSSSAGAFGLTGDGIEMSNTYWYNTGGSGMNCGTSNSVYCINTPPAYIFVTAASFNGNLGGATGADVTCTNAALAGSLTQNLGVNKWRAIVASAYPGRLRLSLP